MSPNTLPAPRGWNPRRLLKGIGIWLQLMRAERLLNASTAARIAEDIDRAERLSKRADVILARVRAELYPGLIGIQPGRLQPVQQGSLSV